MQTLGSVASLLAALRDEAEVEAERLQKAAEAERERFAKADGPLPSEAPDREARVSHARRTAREKLAQQDWLDRRAALESREAFIQDVLKEALRELARGLPEAERQQALAQRVDEAVAQLPGTRFFAHVAQADAPLLQGAVRPEVTVVPDAALPQGELRVRTADGKVTYDNGLVARAQRLEPRWRAALGELFER